MIHKSQLNNLQTGAKKVILSAPSKRAEIVIVHGVNRREPSDYIVSCASCTPKPIAAAC
jgi:glyceraldehyde 3-phosphate dehydrogenase